MTSIIDVAKVAGVSKSTVSRLISGKGYVSADSQEKILKAMKELNYTPNYVARNLRAGATKTIGFLAPSYLGSLGIFNCQKIQLFRNLIFYRWRSAKRN